MFSFSIVPDDCLPSKRAKSIVFPISSEECFHEKKQLLTPCVFALRFEQESCDYADVQQNWHVPSPLKTLEGETLKGNSDDEGL